MTAHVLGTLFGRRHAVVPGGVPADLLDALRVAARGGRYGHATGARQESIAPLSGNGIREAMDLLPGLAAARHLGSPVRPTEATFARLVPGHQGPPRRESRYYAECVAVVVLSGEGELAVHDERVRDRVVDSGRIRPGDVVLLRGWSPLGLADPRPYHRIDAAGGPLTLFRARHNLAAGDRPSAWLAGLTSREVREASVRAALTAWPARTGD